VLAQLGELTGGVADWERYLNLRPEAPDAGTIRQHLRRARQALASLN